MRPNSSSCNRVAALAWQHAFGFEGADSLSKRVPDIVFNVSRALRLAYLRGYLLRRRHGRLRGHVSIDHFSSYDLASGTMYLLSSFGVVASLSEHEPDGIGARDPRRAVPDEAPVLDDHACRAVEDLRKLESDLGRSSAARSSCASSWPRQPTISAIVVSNASTAT